MPQVHPIQHPPGLISQLMLRPRTLPWLLELNAAGIILSIHVNQIEPWQMFMTSG